MQSCMPNNPRHAAANPSRAVSPRSEQRTGIAVIGGGPAGLAAAVEAAAGPFPVTVLDSQPGCGQKLLLTGGGHCNFTHTGTVETFVDAFHGQGRFLYSALSRYDNRHYIDFLAENGLAARADVRNRYLPVTGSARDVLNVYLSVLRRQRAAVRCFSRVTDIRQRAAGAFELTVLETDPAAGGGNTVRLLAQAVILAGGAPCFCQTGSDGALLQLAAGLGLPAVPVSPALAAVDLSDWPSDALAGITLTDCVLSVRQAGRKKPVETERGELLLTHRGLSGPLALNLSRWLTDGTFELRLNTVPDIPAPELAAALMAAAGNAPQTPVRRLMKRHMPEALAAHFLRTAAADPALPGARLNKQLAARLADLATGAQLTPLPFRRSDRGMTCRGGISLKALSPATMMAAAVPGLFAAGDMLDLDGRCGGFNLQAAYSTGRTAGASAVQFLQNHLG